MDLTRLVALVFERRSSFLSSLTSSYSLSFSIDENGHLLRNLCSINDRTASQSHRGKAKKPLKNYIKFEVYHTYYHSLRGYRYKFATLGNYRLQVPRTRQLEVSRTNTETNLRGREKWTYSTGNQAASPAIKRSTWQSGLGRVSRSCNGFPSKTRRPYAAV